MDLRRLKSFVGRWRRTLNGAAAWRAVVGVCRGGLCLSWLAMRAAGRALWRHAARRYPTTASRGGAGAAPQAGAAAGLRGPRCRKCGKLIPAGIEIHTPSGYFCSMPCAEQHEGMQARIYSAGTPMHMRRTIRMSLGGVAILAALCGMFYGLMYIAHGMTDPVEMVKWLAETIRKTIAIAF